MIGQCIRPSNLEEVLEILDGQRNQVQLIAGGTDFVISLRQKGCGKHMLVDISKLKELRFIQMEDREIIIGAGTRFADIVGHQGMKNLCPGLWKACQWMGSPQIRNMGTIGGNICNGSPAADAVPPLLALDAQAVIKRKDMTRTVALKDFYLDKGKVALGDSEILYAVRFLKPREKEHMDFEKLGFRKALAIARVSCAVFLSLEGDATIREIRIATGALGPYPQRETQVERGLKGKKISEELLRQGIKEMAGLVEARLRGRSSALFKGEAIQGLFRRAFYGAMKGVKGYGAHSSYGEW
ncbi:FAD binding domain-containing protein [Thermotalea metallivorans]|uniref:Nicotinate dehydrogenase FAD-subunit n=1 Tax=Thermotalea metallivorans TaxID=520762 RepID=A0A140L3H2_9FIRM|nr:FAD binding domain-containing protein [Thermotalea metallivorans]KXG75097.1 Nicotinate dehydrogenase FAD-subunit [Thermotalea metallivorans]